MVKCEYAWFKFELPLKEGVIVADTLKVEMNRIGADGWTVFHFSSTFTPTCDKEIVMVWATRQKDGI